MAQRRSRAAAALLLGLTVALTVVGCSPKPEPASAIPPLAGTEPNGEQKRTADQLIADARASVRAATAIQLTGELAFDGTLVTVDLLATQGAVSGTVTSGAGSVQLQAVSTGLYVRSTGMTGHLVALLDLPEAVSDPAPESAFWQLDPAADPLIDALALPLLATTLLPASLATSPGVSAGDVNGTPVVTASADGVTVSVAVTGQTRLMELIEDGGHLQIEASTTAPPPPLVTPAAVPTP